MHIMTFVVGTLAVVTAVVGYGWATGWSALMLVLMAGVTLVVGQVMYLIMLVGMAWLSTRRDALKNTPNDQLQPRSGQRAADE